MKTKAVRFLHHQGMRNFIEGTSRHQSYFSTLDEQVATDNAARLMDAFVNKPDLEKLGSIH